MAVVEVIYRVPSKFIMIRYGVYQTEVKQGSTIAELKNEFRGPWNIPDDVLTWRGCTVLSDNYVPFEGDIIDFQRQTPPVPMPPFQKGPRIRLKRKRR